MTTQPYRPANATEGDAFERRWCAHCENDKPALRFDELGDYEGGCPILGFAHTGGEPACWTYRNGTPWCSEFIEDKANPARCLFTKEMDFEATR